MTVDIKSQSLGEKEKGRFSWSTGLAIFAMFFGAGNIVFPLALGQFTQDMTPFGIFGLIITAVLVPMTGLIAMLLYEGDYNAFFKRIGKIPGFALTASILALIGPFGGIPRCITISFSTLNAFGLGSTSLLVFSALSCVLLFFFTYRPLRILSLLGYVLTPLLLVSLAVIVVKGFIAFPEPQSVPYTPWETFTKGLLDGYNTLDLLAAFFFSSVVLLCLRKKNDGALAAPKSWLKEAVMGSLMAAALLSFVYICFAYLAAGYSSHLNGVASDQLLGALAYQLLGPSAGFVASVAVCFACFTTEIALTAIFASFLHKTLFRHKISYRSSLVVTLGIAFLISSLHFSGISAFLVPIVQLCYPALIVLSLLNIAHKLFNYKPVKFAFYGMLALSAVLYLTR